MRSEGGLVAGFRGVDVFGPAEMDRQSPYGRRGDRDADVRGQSDGNKAEDQRLDVVPPPEILMEHHQQDHQTPDDLLHAVLSIKGTGAGSCTSPRMASNTLPTSSLNTSPISRRTIWSWYWGYSRLNCPKLNDGV